jgi:hypothetical protein
MIETVEEHFMPHAIEHLSDYMRDVGCGDYVEIMSKPFADACDDLYELFSQIHQDAFNTDYYIIGTYKAKLFLGEYAFDVIEYIREYESLHFGEVHTDFSNPEVVVNMLMYILGEIAVQNYFQNLEVA